MNRKTTKRSFMENVSIILIAQLMIKMLGMIYRMVITNIEGFGDSGNGYYTAGFQIYTMLLAVSSVGIPNAIAKMVSERAALNDYRGAHYVFKSALKLFSVIGLACTALLFFCSDFVAKTVMNMDGAQYTMRALSPSIFFVCVSSVIRGYFTGLQNMKATSNSQVLEQFFKCGLTILFVVLAIGQPPEIMAAWANLATSVATVLSLTYLLIFYRNQKKGIWKQVRGSEKVQLPPLGKMMKSILMISIPISLGSIITAVNRIIDTATITRGIEAAFSAYIPASAAAAAIINPTLEQLNDEAVRLAGMLSKSDVLINMPLALNIAFSTVLVPSISGAMAVGNKKEAAGKVNYSFLISILLILPCAIGLIALAQPIYMFIYRNASQGADLLQFSAIALVFTALNQTMSGSLQGLGKIYTPATGLLAGCIAKIILNIVLIRIPSINIYGAVISSIVCQLVAFSISFTVLSGQLSLRLSLGKYVLKPLLAGAVMGVCAYGFYHMGMQLLHSNILWLMASIVVAVIVYLLMVFLLRIMNADEITMLPFGNKLAAVLKKRKLLK